MPSQDGVPAIGRLKRALTIQGRIVVITAIAALTAITVGGIAAWQIARVATEGTQIYDKALLPDQEVSALREAVGRARMNGLSRATAKTTAAAADYGKALESDEQNIDILVEAHKKRDLNSTERTALDAFVAAWSDYREARTLGDQYARDGRSQDFENLRTQRMTPDVNNALGSLDKMSAASAANAKDRLDSVASARRTGLTVSLVLLALSLVLIAVTGLFTIRAMVNPLRRLRTVLGAVAEGDLTSRVEVTSTDEVGQMSTALNSTLDTMHDVIRELESTARKLSGHAEQAASQSTTASAAIDLISSEIDTIHAETEGVMNNFAGIRAMGQDPQAQDAAHLQNVINSIGEQVSLLGRTINDNDLAKATRTTASIMDNTRRTADSLAEIAGSLTAMISVFKLEEESSRPDNYATQHARG